MKKLVIIIVGPRGSGKTHRLKWLKQQVTNRVLVLDDCSIPEYLRALHSAVDTLIVTMDSAQYENLPLSSILPSRNRIVKTEVLTKEF